MIEAIPTTQDSIVLVITKVDNPEEFDEKFSRFGIHSDQVSETGEFTFDSDEDVSILDNPELSHCFQQLHDLMDEAAEVLEEDSADEAEETESRDTDTDKGFVPLSESLTGKKNKKDKSKKESKKKKAENLGDRLRLFSFASLNPIIEVSHMALSDFDGKSTIWKDEKNARYYLMVRKGSSKTAFREPAPLCWNAAKKKFSHTHPKISSMNILQLSSKIMLSSSYLRFKTKTKKSSLALRLLFFVLYSILIYDFYFLKIR